MPDPKYKLVELKDLKVEDGAHELFDSPEMQPYRQFLMAVMTGADPTAELEALRRVPLEKRYVWRVASALKWAFVDCEDMNVDADRRTMTADDFAKLRELLKLRPMQFAIFLRALFGPEEMERMMMEAIAVARTPAQG